MDDIERAPKNAQIFPKGPLDWARLRRRRRRLAVSSSEYELTSFATHECLFIHIPKTGGLAVSAALFGSRAGGHRSLKAYEYTFGRRQVRNWYVFTVVRDPIDRYLSAIRFLKNGGMTARDACFNREILAQYRSIDDFTTDWVNPLSVRRQVHLIPQSEFLRSADRSTVDFVAYTESLTSDYEVLRHRLGFGSDLLRENQSSLDDERWTTISPQSRRILNALYAEDSDRFGYKQMA